MSRKMILDYLDDAAREYCFPVLDNMYVAAANQRLTAYSNKLNWVLIIETIGFNCCDSDDLAFHNLLYVFSGCRNDDSISYAQPELHFIRPLSSGPSGQLMLNAPWINLDLFDIRIRDVVVPIRLDQPFFQQGNVQPKYPHQIHGVEFLRALSHLHPDYLFATDAELHQRLFRPIPRIIRLDEWRHPDVAGDELPSQSPSFQMLAEVLDSADPAAYIASQVRPNTHYRNWHCHFGW